LNFTGRNYEEIIRKGKKIEDAKIRGENTAEIIHFERDTWSDMWGKHKCL